jgi:hypothetical protein
MSDLYKLKNGPGPLKADEGNGETATAQDQQFRNGGAKVQDLRRDRLKPKC